MAIVVAMFMGAAEASLLSSAASTGIAYLMNAPLSLRTFAQIYGIQVVSKVVAEYILLKGLLGSDGTDPKQVGKTLLAGVGAAVGVTVVATSILGPVTGSVTKDVLANIGGSALLILL